MVGVQARRQRVGLLGRQLAGVQIANDVVDVDGKARSAASDGVDEGVDDLATEFFVAADQTPANRAGALEQQRAHVIVAHRRQSIGKGNDRAQPRESLGQTALVSTSGNQRQARRSQPHQNIIHEAGIAFDDFIETVEHQEHAALRQQPLEQHFHVLDKVAVHDRCSRFRSVVVLVARILRERGERITRLEALAQIVQKGAASAAIVARAKSIRQHKRAFGRMVKPLLHQRCHQVRLADPRRPRDP